MKSISPQERFFQDTITCQPSLYAYILSLTGDPDWADDVLQETNLALLRKKADFELGTDFLAWATTVAYYQVLTSRKQRQRSKLIFDEQLIGTLAAEAVPVLQQQDARRAALRRCLAELPQRQSNLLQRRYAKDSVMQIAADLRRSVGSISQTLYRIRAALKECVQKKLSEGATP